MIGAILTCALALPSFTLTEHHIGPGARVYEPIHTTHITMALPPRTRVGLDSTTHILVDARVGAEGTTQRRVGRWHERLVRYTWQHQHVQFDGMTFYNYSGRWVNVYATIR